MRKGFSTRRLFTIYLLAFGILVVSDCLIRDIAAQGVTGSQPHLYFFTNDGCAPCRQVEPGIEALKREGYPVTTVKLNDQPQWGARFQVDRTPTVVLVSNSRVVGRHAGLIDGVTLKNWFAQVGVTSGANFAGADRTKVVIENEVGPGSSSTYNRGNDRAFTTPTMHQGTTQPSNSNEQLALQATVRLKVEDPEGISYATGTVIHSHNGESLVMTCGHVFRDSQGTGVITAEYGFGTGQLKSGPGHLISYDAKARDIAVVAIRTAEPITPIPIATKTAMVARGHDIFTLGCDHGEPPTIRHSRIKNRASYDGAIKYDIYGRPVDGRSGGGLFNSQGKLVGVCNAKAVEVDEGIYTALDTIYWQLAQANLEHLFENNTDVALNEPVEMPVPGGSNRTFANADPSGRSVAPGQSRLGQRGASLAQIRPRPSGAIGTTGVSWDPGQRQSNQGYDREVIIIVRSKSDPARADAITVSDPTPGLLDYLDGMQANSAPRQLDVARLRQQHSRPSPSPASEPRSNQVPRRIMR